MKIIIIIIKFSHFVLGVIKPNEIQWQVLVLHPGLVAVVLVNLVLLAHCVTTVEINSIWVLLMFYHSPDYDYAYWFFLKSDYCQGGMAPNQCSPKLLLAAEGSSCPPKYLSGNAQLSRHRPPIPAPIGALLLMARLVNICLSHSHTAHWHGGTGNMWPRDAESGEMEARDEKAFRKEQKRHQIQERRAL